MPDCCKPGSETQECCCSDGQSRLIYPCSGGANTGYLADAIARGLTRSGIGKMTCLAGLGADIAGFVESAKSCDNIVIDGCPVACAAAIFDNRGLPYRHFVITDYGVKKYRTEITPSVLAEVESKISGEITNG